MIPEELQLIIDDAKEKMKEAVSFCKSEFTYIRAGKATPTLLDGIKIDYYGSLTPLNQLATVTAPEDRKSTRLNSSHVASSYAVFCLKKKKKRRLNQGGQLPIR